MIFASRELARENYSHITLYSPPPVNFTDSERSSWYVGFLYVFLPKVAVRSELSRFVNRIQLVYYAEVVFRFSQTHLKNYRKMTRKKKKKKKWLCRNRFLRNFKATRTEKLEIFISKYVTFYIVLGRNILSCRPDDVFFFPQTTSYSVLSYFINMSVRRGFQ